MLQEAPAFLTFEFPDSGISVAFLHPRVQRRRLRPACRLAARALRVRQGAVLHEGLAFRALELVSGNFPVAGLHPLLLDGLGNRRQGEREKRQGQYELLHDFLSYCMLRVNRPGKGRTPQPLRETHA